MAGEQTSEGVEPWASMASGLSATEVFVGGREMTDTRLPREELLDTADGVLETGIMAAIPTCFRAAG